MTKKNEMTQPMMLKALDYAYEKAVNGLPGFDTAQEIAKSYLEESNNAVENANSLIRWQIAKASTSGFVTGLGGVLTMPVTIPLNVSSVLYVQIRMIAAIAYMGGYDIKDDRVKSLVYACMAGNAAKDILKDIGIEVGKKLTINLIRNISAKTVTAINQKVGFRLLTKFGQTGAVNMGKAVPVVGGIIGGVFDGVTTNAVGNIARDTFLVKLDVKS